MTSLHRSIVIHGASDDLVEVSGDINFEHYAPVAGPIPIVLDGEEIAVIEYTADGMWQIEDLDVLAGFTFTYHPALGEDVDSHPGSGWPGYSDVLEISGPIESIAVGDSRPR